MHVNSHVMFVFHFNSLCEHNSAATGTVSLISIDEHGAKFCRGGGGGGGRGGGWGGGI